MFRPLDTEACAALVQRLLAFRDAAVGRAPRAPGTLLSVFPGVRLREGFRLEYAQESTAAGVRLPDRPFARPIEDDTWVPLFDGEPERQELVEQLYQYLEHEPTPAGLFEYALFVLELWTPGTSSQDAEWLESTPIVDAAGFDTYLQTATRVTDVRRPEVFAPLVEVDSGGGRLRFLVHTPVGRQRIYYLEGEVFADGYVEQTAGDLVADLGSGLVF